MWQPIAPPSVRWYLALIISRISRLSAVACQYPSHAARRCERAFSRPTAIGRVKMAARSRNRNDRASYVPISSLAAILSAPIVQSADLLLLEKLEYLPAAESGQQDRRGDGREAHWPRLELRRAIRQGHAGQGRGVVPNGRISRCETGWKFFARRDNESRVQVSARGELMENGLLNAPFVGITWFNAWCSSGTNSRLSTKPVGSMRPTRAKVSNQCLYLNTLRKPACSK